MVAFFEFLIVLFLVAQLREKFGWQVRNCQINNHSGGWPDGCTDVLNFLDDPRICNKVSLS